MKIFYGIANKAFIDVTDYYKPTPDGSYRITNSNYVCDKFVGDPLPGEQKNIYISIDEKVYELSQPNTTVIVRDGQLGEIIDSETINSATVAIHSKLRLKYGVLNDELPEQKMVLRYFVGRRQSSLKVLEIGANIGRNTLMIASLLGEYAATNFVTMECDVGIANQLAENRELNGMNFQICSAALSKRGLIQRGWDTFVYESDIIPDGFTKVNTITWSDLLVKYAIDFNTLVLDCEGAFYYILCDMPEVLDNISLIIMENDYHEYDKKLEVDRVLKEKGFRVDYSEGGGWGPCQNHFFEVWTRT